MDTFKRHRPQRHSFALCHQAVTHCTRLVTIVRREASGVSAGLIVGRWQLRALATSDALARRTDEVDPMGGARLRIETR
jgi:hypothetical protein